MMIWLRLFPLHKHRKGRMRVSLTCLEDRLGGIISMQQCAVPSAWRRLSLSQCCAPGSCRVGQWHGPTLADLWSSCKWLAPKAQGTLAGHRSSPKCRTGTGCRCQTGYRWRPGTLPCSLRVAPQGLDDWAAPFHVWGGHRSWCLWWPSLRCL